MGNSKIDLSKLKKEIEDRKRESNVVVDSDGGTPKDKFLSGLLESLQTGRNTDSTNLLKIVENKTAEKLGETPIKFNDNSDLNDGLIQHPIEQSQPKTPSISDVDREKALYEEFDRKRKELINSGINNIYQPSSTPPLSKQKEVISKDTLNEIVNDLINDKFAIIVEQAMKDSIVEIYTAARMREVLEENRNIIKNIVIEVIRELQTKKKSK